MPHDESVTPDRPIVLVGMMGAGKSVLGQKLAERLGLPFFDSDKVVEARAGLSIPEIFEHFGESRFRQAEASAIAGLIEEGACVLATGGGALMNPETLALLKERSDMIWLDVAFDVLWDRLKDSKNRPLMQTSDPQETLRALLSARAPLYAQAHVRLPIGAEKPEQCLEALIKALSAAIKGDTLAQH